MYKLHKKHRDKLDTLIDSIITIVRESKTDIAIATINYVVARLLSVFVENKDPE